MNGVTEVGSVLLRYRIQYWKEGGVSPLFSGTPWPRNSHDFRRVLVRAVGTYECS